MRGVVGQGDRERDPAAGPRRVAAGAQPEVERQPVQAGDRHRRAQGARVRRARGRPGGRPAGRERVIDRLRRLRPVRRVRRRAHRGVVVHADRRRGGGPGQRRGGERQGRQRVGMAERVRGEGQADVADQLIFHVLVVLGLARAPVALEYQRQRRAALRVSGQLEPEPALVHDVGQQLDAAVDDRPGRAADLDGQAEGPVAGLAAGDCRPVQQQRRDLHGPGHPGAAAEPGGQDDGRAGAQRVGGDLAAEEQLDDVAEDQAVARAHERLQPRMRSRGYQRPHADHRLARELDRYMRRRPDRVQPAVAPSDADHRRRASSTSATLTVTRWHS